MYHLKKKFTKKVKRRTSRVNKKYNRKRVTKKIKLSRKKLNKKNKKNKRRRRSVKRGGELNEENFITNNYIIRSNSFLFNFYC